MNESEIFLLFAAVFRLSVIVLVLRLILALVLVLLVLILVLVLVLSLLAAFLFVRHFGYLPVIYCKFPCGNLHIKYFRSKTFYSSRKEEIL